MSTGNMTASVVTELLSLPAGVTFSHYFFQFSDLSGSPLFGERSLGSEVVISMPSVTAGTYLVTITAVDTSGNQIGSNVITQEVTVYDSTLYYKAPIGVSIQNS